MDSYRITNDLLVYSGTLLIAVLIFAFISISFLGVFLLLGSARLLQWTSARVAAAAGLQLSGMVRHIEDTNDSRPPTSAIPLT